METKFTKGEWTYKWTKKSSEKGIEKFGIFPAADCGFYSHAICNVHCNDEYSRPEAEENAKLIAAAPELLDALILLKNKLKIYYDTRTGFSDDLNHIRIAEQAIKKAIE